MTTAYNITVEFLPSTPGMDADDFELFLDCVMEEFEKLELDVDLTAALARYVAHFLVPVEESTEEGLIKALGSLRTALHAAGCRTAGWPTEHQIIATALASHEATPKHRELVDA